jgi:photosystem II stability/assembly factor-like uncharacterized protein
MGVFRSDNDGKSWEIKVTGLPYTTVHALARQGNRLFCGTSVGLFHSDDHGETWHKGQGIFPLEIAAVAGHPEKGSSVFAADLLVGYLFVSQDHGASWQALDIGQALSRITSLTGTPSGHLLAGTVAEGVFRIVPADTSLHSAPEVSLSVQE